MNISNKPMLKLNKSQHSVISELKSGNTMTRRELCIATGLSWAAISKTISQLQDMGIIVLQNAQSLSIKGRRPAGVFLNPKSYLMGLSIQFDRVEVAILSLKSELVSYNSCPLLNDDDPVPACISLIKKILTPEQKKGLICVGISFPGIIETNKKYVESSAHFPDFEDRAVGEEIKLALDLDVPVFVERNAVCDLVHLVVSNRVSDDSILISLKSGVSAAVYIDRNILYGRSGNIGELGHLLSKDGTTACVCGKKGCIETEISGWAWTRKYSKKMSQAPNQPFSSTFYDGLNRGSQNAVEILQKSIYALYPPLGNLILLLKPHMLIFATNLPPSTALIFSTTINEINSAQKIVEKPKLFFAEQVSTAAGAASLGLLWLSGNPNYKA